MPTLVISADFSDMNDLDYFRLDMVGAVEEIADLAQNGDEDEGIPARAEGTIVVDWDIQED